MKGVIIVERLELFLDARERYNRADAEHRGIAARDELFKRYEVRKNELAEAFDALVA